MRPNEALIRELEAQLGRRDRRQLRLRSPRRLRGTGAGPWGADAAASARLATSRTVHRVLTLLMHVSPDVRDPDRVLAARAGARNQFAPLQRSEEHTSELQSRGHLVCRLLLAN